MEYSAVPVPANAEALTLAVEKGILSEKSKEILDEGLTVKDFEGEEEVPEEEPKDEGAEDEKDEEVQETEEAEEVEEKDDLSVSALIDANETLANENMKLKQEISDLRYKLYMIGERLKQKGTVSEIADADLVKVMQESVVGAIRHATGKVD